ncbi:MAG: hypothetical protein H0X39_00015 [Actinobacteria bacterium]|nr:hypothetical protein [Actinomycetota bacterium]
MTTFLELQDEALDLADQSSLEERGRVKRFLNEAYIELVQRTGTPIKTSTVTTLVDGQGDYDLTATPFSLTDFVRVQMLIYAWGGTTANQTTPLEEVSPQQIYWLRRNSISGVVRAYAFNGLSQLLLYPAPMLGDTLQIAYEYRPALMATDSDTPALLRPEDHAAVVYQAAYRAALLSKSPLASGLAAESQTRSMAAMARQNRAGGSVKRVRRGRGVWIPNDNSTDVRWNW